MTYDYFNKWIDSKLLHSFCAKVLRCLPFLPLGGYDEKWKIYLILRQCELLFSCAHGEGGGGGQRMVQTFALVNVAVEQIAVAVNVEVSPPVNRPILQVMVLLKRKHRWSKYCRINVDYCQSHKSQSLCYSFVFH
ncbi:hypothetical protein Tcan_08257 [Toxocara canis]|uniref:Uncharacterized protein n=1 Tax=Toxocara canis TaxID=6265 RepID=A0A0B2V505_TOXCA|nr:hypothetical protein Tcan_08257 [Toxocara canis]